MYPLTDEFVAFEHALRTERARRHQTRKPRKTTTIKIPEAAPRRTEVAGSDGEPVILSPDGVTGPERAPAER